MTLVRERRAYAPTTAAALALILVLCGVFVVWAGVELAALRSPTGNPTSEEVLAGLTSETTQGAAALSVGLVLLTCLLALAVAVGIARRSAGSRHAGIAVFLFLGVVALASGLSGLMADPPARNAGYGLLCALVDFTIVGLLLARPTAVDFERAEMERLRGAR